MRTGARTEEKGCTCLEMCYSEAQRCLSSSGAICVFYAMKNLGRVHGGTKTSLVVVARLDLCANL